MISIETHVLTLIGVAILSVMAGRVLGFLNTRIVLWWKSIHIKQLEKENAALASWQCPFTSGRTGLFYDDFGHQFCAKELELRKLKQPTIARGREQ